MMVLLDLMRSYESMQRHMENSEKKRCLPSPYTSLSQQPGLHTLNGGVQGLRLMGVLPREEGDRVSLCPWAEPFAPSAFPGRVLLGVCAVEEGGEQRPTKACGAGPGGGGQAAGGRPGFQAPHISCTPGPMWAAKVAAVMLCLLIPPQGWEWVAKLRKPCFVKWHFKRAGVGGGGS